VELYTAKDAKKDLDLGRNEMVALAMLLGGDYTSGVKGVGIVNGMEILRAFSMRDGVRNGLTLFRKWIEDFDPVESSFLLDGKPMTEEQRIFHTKHLSARNRWVVPQDFPAPNALNAYLKPVVDASRSKFSWGQPDFDNIMIFCANKIGWSIEQTNAILGPLKKKLQNTQGRFQMRIDSYFMKYEDDIKFASVRSKRLRAVMQEVKADKNNSKKKRKA